MLNQIMPQLQQLNDLWEQTTRPQQRTYTDFAEQYPMGTQLDNPYGDYGAMRERRMASQQASQQAIPEMHAEHGGHAHEGGSLKGYKITSGFGGRKDPFTGKHTNHNGIDLGMAANTKLTSPVDGVVVETRNSKSWGNTIVIRDSAGNLHRYAHMNGINVKPGQKVGRGTFVGLSGNTGRSTGAHLHYEVTGAKGGSLDPSMFF